MIDGEMRSNQWHHFKFWFP